MLDMSGFRSLTFAADKRLRKLASIVFTDDKGKVLERLVPTDWARKSRYVASRRQSARPHKRRFVTAFRANFPQARLN